MSGGTTTDAARYLRDTAEAIRLEADRATPGRWESLNYGDRLIANRDDGEWAYVVDEPVGNQFNAAHIASWDPTVARAAALAIARAYRRDLP